MACTPRQIEERHSNALLNTFPGSYGATNWPSGDQWVGGLDWTGDNYNSDGSAANVSMLAMGKGNPLQPGTYYVGVYDPYYTNSYTLVSRGIGTNYSIPVVALDWAKGAATNTLAPREAAYYAVVIPTNTPSWHVRVAPAVGDAVLVVQGNALPSSQAYAYPYGSAIYPASQNSLPSGGIRMQKTGNEHYTLLPANNTTNLIPAGTYYLAVASEGINSQAYTLGSNVTTYVVQSLGFLSISNLGMVGPTDLLTTNALLEGGDVAAYQFTVPPNELGFEIHFENAVGNPLMSLVATNLLPSSYQKFNYPDYHSSEGGQTPTWSSGGLITVPNPAPGTYSLLVNAAELLNGLLPDSAFNLHVSPITTPSLNISGVFNTNGGTNVVSGTLADTESAFYQVFVPDSLGGVPILGWKLDLTTLNGTPSVRVRQNYLPDNINNDGTSPFNQVTATIVPPYLTPGTWYVEVNASGLTTYSLTSSVITTNTLAHAVWVMPSLGQTNTAPGLALPFIGDSGIDTNGDPLPGDQGVDLAQGEYDYYAVIVPSNNAALLRTELQAISGNPNLFLRVGAAPTLAHYSGGSFDIGGYSQTPLYYRSLTGGTTEYANWVPLNGRYETELTNGLWILAVQAGGNGNARYRLQLSCGNSVTNGLVQDLALNGGSFINQNLNGDDWRYYRVQIPDPAPTNWAVSFTRTLGSAIMFVRDTVPPGDGNNPSPVNYANPGYNPGPWYPSQNQDLESWAGDDKNEGPYPRFDAPGSYNLTTPPLRPGSTYYLGFWSPVDTTFSVSSIINGGYLTITNVASLDVDPIGGTVPPYSSVQYRIDVPTNFTGIVFNASNSANIVLSLEQGTIALPGGPAHWVGASANSSLNQPFNGVWPWLPGYTYYLTATNTSAVAGTFNLTAPDLAPASLASDATAASPGPMNVWFTITNAGNGMSISPNGSWYDQVTLSTNGSLAGAVTSWGWYFTGPLAAGGSYTVTNSITLPQLPAGVYYLILQTDTGNYIPESDESNNVSAAVSFTVITPLVQNGGFETGDFTGWELSGNTSGLTVTSIGSYVHAGQYGVEAGPSGTLGYLSQTIATIPGQGYLLSFWLENLSAATPNQFEATWNGADVYSTTNLPLFAWTNLQFGVRATSAATTFTLRFRNDSSDFGLDDVSVSPGPLAGEALAFQGITLSGTSLSISGANPLGSGSYVILTSTNLALPFNLWTPILTNILAGSGDFSFTATNAVFPHVPNQYYLLEKQ